MISSALPSYRLFLFCLLTVCLLLAGLAIPTAALELSDSNGLKESQITGASQGTSESQWRAGTATVDITPEEPMPMAGYAFREDNPFEEVAHPLYAKALVLEDDEGNRFVMITTDLIGIHRDLREYVVQQVYERFSIPPELIFLNASHTHSGPQVTLEPYRTNLRGWILEAIEEAMEDLEPVTVSYAHASAGFAMNRRANHRLPSTDPYFGQRYNPEGPVDHQVPVLILEDEQESLKSLVFGYACHNTTMGTQQISGDYAGFAQYYLEETHPGVTALFVTGAGADQNPHPRWEMVPGKTPLDVTRMHGRTLAISVEAALNAHPRKIEGPIRASYETVDLAFDIPQRHELERQLEHGSDLQRQRARMLLEQMDEGSLRTHYDYPLQVVTFGREFTFIGMGGEVVVDYSLRLKEEIDDRFLWVAAYANDYSGYIPSRRVLLEGGYEGTRSLNRYGALFTPDVEERIMEKIHDMHDRLRAGGGEL